MNSIPLLACAFMFAIPVDAQGEGAGRERPGRGRAGFGISAEAFATLLRKYDKNEDGKIDRAEYPRGDTAFGNLDRDGNGAIDEKDLDARPQRTPAGRRGQGRRGAGAGARRPVQPMLPRVGDPAPDFELPFHDAVKASAGDEDTEAAKGKEAKGSDAKAETVKLSSFAGNKPVALIFGSYT
ncbi:MAG: hypothetical protein KDC98_07790 [Planctomycetes bacterium]|nr:hypothetical protein [Planctomycetota bacterium]